VTAVRHLLLARDPVAAWRAWAAAGAGAGKPRVFLASLRAAPHFGVGAGATTLERWARTPPTLVATPLARRRALVAAVAEAEGVATGDAAGAAAVAGPAVRELLRFADLDAPPADLDPRLARWWAVARRYRAALDAAGSVDPAEALRRATARWRAAGLPPAPVALLGHLDLAPDELDAVDALAGPGSVVLLPHDPPWTDANDAARAALRGRGWVEVRVDDAAPWPEVVALAPATPEVEARWAVAEAKRLLASGWAPGDVVLTARDVAAYAAPLRAAARAAGVPLRIDRWRPLAATTAGAPAVAWLEAVAQRGAFEATLAWLAHPRVARLTADDVDAVRRWRPNDARAWARVDGAAAAALAWPERATPGAWRELLEAGWTGLGVAPAADPVSGDPDPAANVADPFADPTLAGPWRDALASLADLADPAGRVARAAALGALRDALHAESVRDDGGADGAAAAPLTLRPIEALADARAPHVLLLGAVDGALPTVTPDDPVLGFHDRAALAAAGVPLRTAGQFARLEALRFWGVRRAATERLWIGVPAQTGRDARLPSPFLARLGVAPRVVGEPPPASPAAFRAAALRAFDAVPDAVDPVLPWARRAYAQALAREVEPRWGPDDGFPGLGVDPDAQSWSATQLTLVGSCRFRWWVQRVWGVAAPEEGATELTPLLEGRLYHGALEGALKGAVGLTGAAARAAAAAALDAAFERSERREGIADVVPHWSRRRDDHLAHLRALVAAPAFLPDDHEVVKIESRFEGIWHGWRVSGRVDRIDRTPDGVRLVDYKLGSGRPLGARDAELQPTLDLQLPLYVDVAAPQHAPGERVAGAAYLSLRKMTELAADPPAAAELDDLFERVRSSLRAGFFPVEPHPSLCGRCDLALVCRKGPHLERKPATHRVPPAEGPA
jgi:RecB family exonuclease